MSRHSIGKTTKAAAHFRTRRLRGLHRPGPGCRARTDPARGLRLGLEAQIMLGSGPSSGLVKIITNKHYTEHFGFYRVILFFAKKICGSAPLILVKQYDSGYKSHQPDFLGNFRSCLPQKQFEITPYKLAILYFVQFLGKNPL